VGDAWDAHVDSAVKHYLFVAKKRSGGEDDAWRGEKKKKGR